MTWKSHIKTNLYIAIVSKNILLSLFFTFNTPIHTIIYKQSTATLHLKALKYFMDITELSEEVCLDPEASWKT